MEWEFLAPMIVSITLILTCGGVLLFRPLARRLGELLEIMAKERRGQVHGTELERMTDLLETMNARLSLLEERQDFTDSLLSPRREARAAAARSPELLEETAGGARTGS